ncbi:hypothetical protein [Marinobacterium arenosum]|uniref:hypothetical protein n=1 Tax=Marinobacterium arenosum TaxID=2862496 RepID=UPI001C9454A8|nr:hypothetical protein [Marinobacterium arenosum]MBY4675376.1 hypothetical protein [Marinobacterium arenosum]
MPTKRHAQARIINQTGKDILVANIAHKYSDNYQQKKDFKLIKNGETSTESLDVMYNTGAFTTGRDWWLVSWINSDNEFCYTDPNNFRGLFDFAEQALKDGINISAAIGTAITDLPMDKTAPSLLSKAVLNDSSTAGFKQHILRPEDEGHYVDFILKKGNQVLIKSPSGPSETVYSVNKAKTTATA